MRHKTAALIEAKADESGTFTALASVFGNVDMVGDRMLKGAFTKTLERWRASGDPIPVILSHQWDDPMAMVGKADPHEVVETEAGLVVKGQLDISDNAVAKQVHKLMSQRLLKGWSFGYTVPEGGEKVKDGVNEVSEVDLIEVGPTLKGANPAAQLQAVKSALEVEVSKDVPPAVSTAASTFADVTVTPPPQPPTAEVEGAPEEEREPTPKASDPIGDEFQLERFRAFTKP